MADYKFSVISCRIFSIFSIGIFQNSLLLLFLALSQREFYPGQSQIFSSISLLHPGLMKISPNACFQLPSSKVSPRKRWHRNFVVFKGPPVWPRLFCRYFGFETYEEQPVPASGKTLKYCKIFHIVLVCSEMAPVFFQVSYKLFGLVFLHSMKQAFLFHILLFTKVLFS